MSCMVSDRRQKKLPSSVVDFLEDSSIAKVGVEIKRDCTRLFNLFGEDVKNVVDPTALAMSRKVGLGLRRGLADLCAHLLKNRLPKEQRFKRFCGGIN